jgi:DNA (cytosine-5)-methyltransferase 1
LFSGIGGFALAAKWAGFRTVAFVELDKYCQKVLAKNFMADAASGGQQRRPNGIESKDQRKGENGSTIGAGLQPTAISRSKIHSNIFDFDGTAYRGVDLITGGFPCQPFSVAGKRRGAADDRAIWPQMFRVIKEARPKFVLAENVPGIIAIELDNVLSDLEGIGYATRAFVIPACAVDARHRRDRLWIVGRLSDAGGARLEGCEATGNTCGSGAEREEQSAGLCGAQELDDTEGAELAGQRRDSRGWRAESGRCCRWLSEPDVGRVAVRLPRELDCYRYEPEWEGVPRVSKGVKDRVSRLKALGNSIQSQVAYELLREIRKLL